MSKQFEIERKYLPKHIPKDIDQFPYHSIEQGYLCTSPVVRIRKKDNSYILTYKSAGMLVREEYEHPLSEEGYLHLRNKCDGLIIEKRRYLIPDSSGHTIELDVFKGVLSGFVLAEVEFASQEAASQYVPPTWLGDDVTHIPLFHNSRMSFFSKNDTHNFIKQFGINE